MRFDADCNINTFEVWKVYRQRTAFVFRPDLLLLKIFVRSYKIGSDCTKNKYCGPGVTKKSLYLYLLENFINTTFWTHLYKKTHGRSIRLTFQDSLDIILIWSVWRDIPKAQQVSQFVNLLWHLSFDASILFVSSLPLAPYFHSTSHFRSIFPLFLHFIPSLVVSLLRHFINFWLCLTPARLPQLLSFVFLSVSFALSH